MIERNKEVITFFTMNRMIFGYFCLFLDLFIVFIKKHLNFYINRLIASFLFNFFLIICLHKKNNQMNKELAGGKSFYLYKHTATLSIERFMLSFLLYLHSKMYIFVV